MRQIPLVMPKMSMTMTEGVLVSWRKAAGEQVRSGEVVCDVGTDKIDMEVESPVDGTVARLVASPDQTVPVGEPIAYIASGADDLLEGLLGETPQPPGTPAAGPLAAAGIPADAAAPAGRPVRSGPAAVPLARRRAAELRIDLAGVTATGPGSTIRVADVESARPAGGPDTQVRAKSGPRAAIARLMTASAAVPQFVVYRDINLDALAASRRQRSWTTLIIRAHASALRENPLSATWTGADSQRPQQLVVALATPTGRGLLAPVIPDPDLCSADVLDERIRALIGRAQAGKLSVADLAPATTTLFDLGELGVHSFHTMLSPPQATALSVGMIGPQVIPVRGGIGTGIRCRVGLTVDHRAGNPAEAARLLEALQQRLAEPGWFE
jgi:pyruvate dehydrogenase E2 component (dihydrolipoamide acetyltransferase)